MYMTMELPVHVDEFLLEKKHFSYDTKLMLRFDSSIITSHRADT